MARKKKKENNPEINKLTVIPFEKQGGLAEIYQSMGVKISLLEPKDKNIFQEITKQAVCYDFIVDCYSSSIEKHNFSIYGFSWQGAEKSPSFDGIYLNVIWPDKSARKNFEKNLHFIHEIEDKNGIEKTKIYNTGELSAAIIGSKDWLQNCIKFRLYLFFFRCFSYEIKTNDWIEELGKRNSITDSLYIKSTPRENWDIILNDLSQIHTEEFCGLSFKKHGSSQLHHNSGFFSVAGGTHTEVNPEIVKQNKHFISFKERGVLKMRY